MRSILYFSLYITYLLSCNSNIETSKHESSLMTNTTENAVLTEGLVHTVLFWYKEDISSEQIDEFMQSLARLGDIATVSYFHYGPPAKTLQRGPVDHTYDMAVNVFFKDLAAHDAYQKDPTHLEFKDKTKELWEKVVIYDNQISQ